jgi:hypothetical protein
MAHVLLPCLAGVRSANSPAEAKRESTAMENHSLVERVRSEFIEMPGLRLTPAQAARLWGMDDASCHHVISALVRVAFLRWTATGMVVRSDR